MPRRGALPSGGYWPAMTTAPFEPDPTDPDISPSTEPVNPIAPGEDPGVPMPDPDLDPTES